MARTAATITDMPLHGQVAEISFEAADDANGMHVPNDGRIIVLVKNDSGSGAVVTTVTSVADAANRTGDLTPSTGDGEVGVIGPFRPEWWNQKSGTYQGSVLLDFDTGTGITVAALRLPPG